MKEKDTKKKENKVAKAIKQALGTIVLGLKYICMGLGGLVLMALFSVSIDMKKHPEKYKNDETEE